MVTAAVLMYALFATGSVNAGGTGSDITATSACHCIAAARTDRAGVPDQLTHCPAYSACAGGMCATLPIAIALESVLAASLSYTPDRRAHHSLSAPPQSKPPAFI